jgi:hypothetical protein
LKRPADGDYWLVIAAVRANTDEHFIIGLRISADKRDPEGMTEDESLAAVQLLPPLLDYVHVVADTSASLGGAVHIVPPMAIEAAYLAKEAGTFKASLSIPLFVTRRINQPQEDAGIAHDTHACQLHFALQASAGAAEFSALRLDRPRHRRTSGARRASSPTSGQWHPMRRKPAPVCTRSTAWRTA